MKQFLPVLLSGAVLSVPAMAEDHAVGARVGLLGVGLEYSYRVNQFVTVRGGINRASYGFDETESGINYDFDLEFDSTSVGVDIHPLTGSFRVSLGFLQNDNGLSASSTLADSFTIGDTTYAAEDVGNLSGRIGFDSTAPFVGVGWDWLRDKKVGMSLELGILKQGSPKVRLSASGPIADNPDFMADLDTEIAELEADLDNFDTWPYAMLGVVVRF